MKIKNVSLILTGCFVLTFLSCITVNIYFPEATVKKTAEEIVDEVRKSTEKDKDKKEKKEAAQSFFELKSFSFTPLAYAQKETTVSSPKIRGLKQSLRERFLQLKSFFDSGNIGETNDGFIQIREEGSLGLREKASLRSLIKDENSDRKVLYGEVARALNIDSSQISRIGKIFAENWIRDAQPGWWIQKEDGEWIRKQE
jgi:uncharacterized protein YdbL (DUF1318 family)